MSKFTDKEMLDWLDKNSGAIGATGWGEYSSYFYGPEHIEKYGGFSARELIEIEMLLEARDK
jgi:hypothetical protein